MKNTYHLTILALSLMLFSSSVFSEEKYTARTYPEALQLFKQGNFVDAKAKFDLVIKKYPRHPARSYSYRCQQAILSGKGVAPTIEMQLKKIMIPSVDFQDVPVGDALTYIRQRSQEITGGKVTPNIIFAGSKQQREDLSVTLKLNQIPAATLLKYIGEQSRCRIKYDKHVILVTPYSNVPKETVPVKEEEPNPFGTKTPAVNPF